MAATASKLLRLALRGAQERPEPYEGTGRACRQAGKAGIYNQLPCTRRQLGVLSALPSTALPALVLTYSGGMAAT